MKESTLIKEYRQRLFNARRVIIKVGTNVLVSGNSLDTHRIGALVREIARIKEQGRELIVITSGAIGAGMKTLGMARRPKSVHEQQIAASVGQTVLIGEYARSFAKHGIHIGQVLLTHEDLSNRERHLNMRHTVMGLLRRNCVPVVNENDVISVAAIKVGDNDALAALLGLLVEADLVILLSTTDGLKRPVGSARMERIPYVEKMSSEVASWVTGKENDLSVGGMGAKLTATQTLTDANIPVVIADGRDPKNISRIFSGDDIGTLFGMPKQCAAATLRARKRWIAFFHRPKGGIIVDQGAARALKEKGKSLLAVGVSAVEGSFPLGALVNIKDHNGNVLARGLAECSSSELEIIKGHKTSEIAALLGPGVCEEVIHRDNMVLL